MKPLADDKRFQAAFLRAKREAKSQFADWLRATTKQTVDPHSIFDCQVKRIHEYKRQLLNALRVVVLYNRLRENPNLEMGPRTFFFAGKAAPVIGSPSSSLSSSITSLALSTETRRCVAG